MAEATQPHIISPVNVAKRRELEIRPGDTVRVTSRIEEKGKTRLQKFEGVVIAVKHGKEAGGTFTVRRVSGGIGVEKIFPIYTPLIEQIEIVKRSKVRRAKLYHIKKKAAREIKRQMRRTLQLPDVAMVSGGEDEEASVVKEEGEQAVEQTEETQATEVKPETTPEETQEATPAETTAKEAQTDETDEAKKDEEAKDA